MSSKGVIGKPKYKVGDEVTYKYEGTDKGITGIVHIVDAYGTFEQNEEPSYDIMVQNYKDTGEPCLVKHIRESIIE